MKRALLIGIDHYEYDPLKGCVDDAIQLAEILSENYDGSPNYDCHLLISDTLKREETGEESNNTNTPSGNISGKEYLQPSGKAIDKDKFVDLTESESPVTNFFSEKKKKKSPISEADKKKVPVTVAQLQRDLAELLSAEADAVLFYFSGHGLVKNFDGYIVTQDSEAHNPGFPISSLIRQINNASHIREITVILDCCYSGFTGSLADFGKDRSVLRKGVSILASSQANGHSRMKNNTSIFTKILIEALNGAAADLLGNVAVPDIYSYADKVLGPWEQRPLLICHVSTLRPLRRTKSTLTYALIRKVGDLFEHESASYQLDRSFLNKGKNLKSENKKFNDSLDVRSNKQAEREESKINLTDHLEKREVFKALSKFYAAGLIKPCNKKLKTIKQVAKKNSCYLLTFTGQAYWRIVNNDQI